MNGFVKSSLIVFCTFFSMSYASQVPKQQCVDALLTIDNFKEQHSDYVDWYVDLYDKFAIPYDERDNLFVCLKAVRVQEYNGLSVTNWLKYVPLISPLRKGLVKAVPLSDRKFPKYVPARWLVDTNGAVKQDVSLEFAKGMTKVNFTVFLSTDVNRELAAADNNIFIVMEQRKEKEFQFFKKQRDLDAEIARLTESIRSKQSRFGSYLSSSNHNK